MDYGKGSLWASLLVMPVLVAGCGSSDGNSNGGGGSGSVTGDSTYSGSTKETSLDKDNGAAAAGGMVNAYATAGGAAGSGDTIATGVAEESGQKAAGLAAEALRALRLAREHDLLAQEAQIAGVRETCPEGGKVEADWSLVSPSEDIFELDTVGDEVTITYDSCHFSSTIAYDGAITITLEGIDTNTDPTTRDLQFGFNNLLVAHNGATLYGVNGGMRLRRGKFADNFPSGKKADIQLSLGVNGPLEIVNNRDDLGFEISNGNFYLGDGTKDGSLNTSRTWYLRYYGDSNGNPMEVCTTFLNGCVTLDDDTTTDLTFNSGSTYPTSGVLRGNGSGGSYVKLSANTSEESTVQMTGEDADGNSFGSVLPVDWSTLSDSGFPANF